MDPLRSTSLVEKIVGLPLVWMILWAGLASLTIALLVLMRTQWGQSQPLRKCTVLSLFAHALLACFATTVKIVSVTSGPADDPISISIAAGDAETQVVSPVSETREPAPWDSPSIRSEEPPAQPPERMANAEPLTLPKPAESVSAEVTTPLDVSKLRPEPEVDASAESVPFLPPVTAMKPQATKLDAPAAQRVEPKPIETPAAVPERTDKVAEESPAPTRKTPYVEQPQSVSPLLPLERRTQTAAELAETPSSSSMPNLLRHASAVPPLPVPIQPEVEAETADSQPSTDSLGEDPPEPSASSIDVAEGELTPVPKAMARDQSPAVASEAGEGDSTQPPGVEQPFQLPTIYKQRFAHDRLETVKRHGGGPETEAAVEAALRWLAANQEADGHWDANRHGAGKETRTLGHDREHAGLQANTGMTALAVLAFMGAGNTHQTGQYSEQVRQGLQYLLNSQARDGNLAGEATLFARMYCHGMAAFALAEAYAMTGDDRLQPAVHAAIAYTVRAQRKNSGGWRYQPGDLGDTSQTGWQLMAIKSAELCGEEIPGETRVDVHRFLSSVTGGQFGGLASYRPHHAVSRSMTAEAMYCRQLINDTISPQAANEAAIYLLGELPGRGDANLYYWYYGTLCLYYQQGEAWDRWNDALKTTLLRLQTRDGQDAGSWNPTTVWGGYGGRVYSTSMAAMNLEIYYRYLPMHIEQARRRQMLR